MFFSGPKRWSFINFWCICENRFNETFVVVPAGFNRTHIFLTAFPIDGEIFPFALRLSKFYIFPSPSLPLIKTLISESAKPAFRKICRDGIRFARIGPENRSQGFCSGTQTEMERDERVENKEKDEPVFKFLGTLKVE